ncbi:hypothetical protein GCM10027343_01630 [Noviherbaspirillum agri]
MINDINAWFDHLQVLFEPTGVLLVGAGGGTGDWVRQLVQWDVANVTLVEAEETQFERLQRNFAQRDGWRICGDVVASETGTVAYHRASNPAESGLLEPETLRNHWPNIKTEEKQTRQAIVLAELLKGAAVNWLLVNCLPALPIIQGAGSMNGVDVVVARVLLSDSEHISNGADLPVLKAYLAAQGYRFLAAQPGRHPGIGHAVFIRDRQLETLELQQQLAQLNATNSRNAELYAEQLALQATIVRELEASTDQIKELTEAKAAAENFASECQQQIEQLTSAKANAERLAAERATQLEALTQDHHVAQAEKDRALLDAKQELEKYVLSAHAEKAAWAKEKTDLLQAKEKVDRILSEKQVQITALEQQFKQVQAQSVEDEVHRHQLEKCTAQIKELTEAKAAAENVASERQQQIEQLSQRSAQEKNARDALIAKHADECSVQIQRFKEAQAAAEKLADARQQQIEQLTSDKAIADKLATERAAQLEALKQDHHVAQAEKESALSEAKQQIEKYVLSAQTEKAAWAKEKTDLLQAKEKVDRLLSEKQAQIAALEQRLLQMQAQSAENELHSHHMEVELLKAETQIALIKELILSEQEL